MNLRISFLLLLFIYPLTSYEQVDDLEVLVYVRDLHITEPLTKTKILVLRNNEKFLELKADENAQFEFNLPLDYGYHVYVQCKEYITKYLLIDTRGIPEETKEGGFKIDLDFSLLKKRKYYSQDTLKAPIGIARFDKEKETIEFDFRYTRKKMVSVDAENRRVDSLHRPQFDKLVAEGKKLSKAGKEKKAIKKYKQAFELIPTNDFIRRKLNLYQEEDYSKPVS